MTARAGTAAREAGTDVWTINLVGEDVPRAWRELDDPPSTTVVAWTEFDRPCIVTGIEVWHGESRERQADITPHCRFTEGDTFEITYRLEARADAG